MSKNYRIVGIALVSYLVIASLHLWLNIGLENLGLFRSAKTEARFKVGFLPVT